jgi:hypothetical protein
VVILKIFYSKSICRMQLIGESRDSRLGSGYKIDCGRAANKWSWSINMVLDAMNTQELKQNKNILQRFFMNPANVEVEICTDTDGKHFVRHHIYWCIVHANKNPVYNCVIDNLKIMTNNRLSTVKWAGHDFQFKRIAFEDGMEVEAVLLPLKMFEDFIRFQSKNYRGEPPDNECTQLGRWLGSSSLEELLVLPQAIV